MAEARRAHTGDRFNEGARQLWLALKKRGFLPVDAVRATGLAASTINRYLYGDQRPGRSEAAILHREFGIGAELWDAAPRVAFAPKSAQLSRK